jgi:Fe2+ or Zn2+ uptake regulation protein
MKKKKDWILSAMKDAGHKMTTPRKKVAAWLEAHEGVFSAGEAAAALPTLDRVSVYRAIELLASLDIVHQVLTTHGEVHYEKHEETHHHHAVCTKCEKTSCVNGCAVPTVKKIKGFTNIHHSLVFTGLCSSCANS